METNYRIKNFRVFDSDGCAVELSPITILTGCNSSGKSSLVKSLFMLDDFLKQIKYALDNDQQVKLQDYKIDFLHADLRLLGNFNNVYNKYSRKKEITITYDTFSAFVGHDISVELVFYTKKEDDLHNGYLKKLSIWDKQDGFCIYSIDLTKDIVNADFNKIKGTFLGFSILQYDYCKGKEVDAEYRYKAAMGDLDENEVANNLELIRYANITKEYYPIFSKQLLRPHAQTILFDKEPKEISEKRREALVEMYEKNYCIHYLPIFEELREIKKEDGKKQKGKFCPLFGPNEI